MQLTKDTERRLICQNFHFVEQIVEEISLMHNVQIVEQVLTVHSIWKVNVFFILEIPMDIIHSNHFS